MQHFIDSVALSQQPLCLSGALPLTAFPRVMQVLYGTQHGELRYCLDFAATNNGEALIRGVIEATITLQCQRCLEAMEWPLKIEVQVIVVEAVEGEGKSAADERAEVWVVANRKKAPLKELIADEVILALPFAPLHAVAKCSATTPPTSEIAGSPLCKASAHPQSPASPFAVLAQLRRSK